MIIKLQWDGKNKQVIESPDGDFYNVPTKLYGDTEQRALRVWNDYVYFDKTTGCLLTGDQGTGKTLLGQLIANIAIKERNLPVYMVSAKAEGNQDVTNLIDYINNLRECVIFMDEFGKMIRYTAQDQFLTMLSDLKKTKKIFILTENDTYNINRYILNRPGRIKYHFDYTKINSKVLLDYCKDKGVNDSFIKELVNKHEKTNVFSFDQLEAIVDEHRKYPTESLKDITEVLNVAVLRTKVTYTISSVYDRRKEEYVEFKPMSGLNQKDIGLRSYTNVVIHIKRSKPAQEPNDITQLNQTNQLTEAIPGMPVSNYKEPEYTIYNYNVSDDDKVAIVRDENVVLTTPEYIITYTKEDN